MYWVLQVDEVKSGEIAALFGVECNSGDTLTTGHKYTMTSMFVPPAVVSLAIKLEKAGAKALIKTLSPHLIPPQSLLVSAAFPYAKVYSNTLHALTPAINEAGRR